MKTLTQEVFNLCPKAEVACVDFDGLLKFGINAGNVRTTWASERWRGAEWVKEIPNSGYIPLGMIRRTIALAAIQRWKDGGG